MRNIRDYKAKVRPDSDTLGSASPFNIVTKALTHIILQAFLQRVINGGGRSYASTRLAASASTCWSAGRKTATPLSLK